MILSIQPEGSDEVCQESINLFFKTYIGAVQSFVQSMGIGKHDAEDIAQEVFSSIHHSYQYFRLHPDKGRMRAYFKVVAKNRVLQFHRKNSRLKRGGNQQDLSLDDFVLPDSSVDPDRDFDRRWTYRLLELTKDQLDLEYTERGRKEWFDALFPSITSDDHAISYREIAKKINSTESAVKVASHRMRQKYRETLRSQVARTVGSEEEVDQELQALFKVLSGE